MPVAKAESYFLPRTSGQRNPAGIGDSELSSTIPRLCSAGPRVYCKMATGAGGAGDGYFLTRRRPRVRLPRRMQVLLAHRIELRFRSRFFPGPDFFRRMPDSER